MDGIDQEVDGGEAAGEEGAPLPVVVLPGRRNTAEVRESQRADL